MAYLKDKLLEVLKQKNYTYTDLASHLSMSEQELDEAIENNTLEIRALELISKELRIPLYSFFRENFENFDFDKEPYYNVSIWDKADEDAANMLPDIRAMRLEIEMLRSELKKKEQLINELQAQISKSK